MAKKFSKTNESEQMLNKSIGFDGLDSALKSLDNFFSEEPYTWESTQEKKIRRFQSGAVRSDDTGRIRPDYISPYAEAEIAEHFTTAKNDFGPTNYFLGIEPVDIYPSMKRHMLELGEGLMKKDDAMIRSALRSLGANAIMGLHQIVLEEKGEYVKRYESTELVNAKEYLSELEGK